MVAEVKGVECPEGQWTAISTGKAKVLAVVRDVGSGRIATGATMPAAGMPSVDYLTLDEHRPVSLSFEDTTTNVYVWPMSVGLVIEVVRE
ncbi:MAG: hypothetical protein DI589_17225 [Shinella sp.]|nr:MAG: hypothetical protein DI589_17225 [Shinella sp.]